MRKNDPDWEDDETAPVCLAQDLSAWTLARLRECGVDEAFLATARKRYEEETIYGSKDGNPTKILAPIFSAVTGQAVPAISAGTPPWK